MKKSFIDISLKKPEINLWLWCFITLCLTFSFLTINLIWGNHDWDSMIVGNPITSGLIEGRFSQYLLPNLLIDGQIFPLINIILGFASYALAMTMLYTRFFDFKPSFIGTLTLCAVSILPYIIEILYFQFIILSQLFWPLTITLALLAAKKSLNNYPVIFTTLSTLILFFTIGGYPAAINLYLTATILFLLQCTTKETTLKKLLQSALPFIISFIISFMALYVVHKGLQAHHTMLNLYNNQPLSLKALILKIPFMYKAVVLSLLQPQPYLSLPLKLIMIAVILLFFITDLITQKTHSNRLLHLCLWLCLPFALKFSAWLISENPDEYFTQHDPVYFMLRTDFYAVPVFLMYCLSALNQKNYHFLKNLSFALAFALLWLNLSTDFNYTKVQKLGFAAETLLQQRINNRIMETTPFDFKNNYIVVQAGEVPLRPRYYTAKPFENYGLYTMQIPSTRHWLPNEFYTFYEPENFVLPEHAIHPENMTPEIIEFLSGRLGVWPSKTSLYIDNNYIILSLTLQGRQMITKQFKNLRSSNNE